MNVWGESATDTDCTNVSSLFNECHSPVFILLSTFAKKRAERPGLQKYLGLWAKIIYDESRRQFNPIK